MKNFFRHISDGFRSFMAGRYGADELSSFLSIAALVLLVLSTLVRQLFFLYFLALGLLIWSSFRMLSRNTLKRRQEREAYLRFFGSIRQKWNLMKNRWRDRKTHRYYTCPSCRVTIRVPKPEKGKTIAITCPKCGNRFERKN